MPKMLKRLLILASLAAAMLMVAVPAFAQSPPQAENDARVTGVIQEVENPPLEGPPYAITEDGTGDEYGIFNDTQAVDLSQYIGQRVTVNGIFQTLGSPLPEDPSGLIIYVTSVEVEGPETEQPNPDDSEEIYVPQLVAFQGYAANVGVAGMRVDSDRSGKPCLGGESLQVAFTADTKFSALRNGELYPITMNEIGQGDSVEVAYTVGSDEAVPDICPSFPIDVDEVNLLEDSGSLAPGDTPGKNPTAPVPGSDNPGQYDNGDGAAPNDQYDGADKDVPPADSGSPNGDLSNGGSSGSGSSGGGISILPDTGGLSPVTIGLISAMFLSGGLLTYAAIRQR